MDHLRYDGGNGDEFASEDGYSCEGDYYSDVDVPGIAISESGGSESGISESDDRVALYGVPECTTTPDTYVQVLVQRGRPFSFQHV